MSELKSGASLNSTLLPGKVFSYLSEEREVIPNVRVAMPTAMVITDLKSGESVSYGMNLRNDILGLGVQNFSFQNGYMVQSFNAIEFKQVGQNALSRGLLTGSAAEQVEEILSNLQNTDNDVIMLTRLKD